MHVPEGCGGHGLPTQLPKHWQPFLGCKDMSRTHGLLLQVHGEGEKGREVLGKGWAALCSCVGGVFCLGLGGDRSFVDLVGTAFTIRDVRRGDVLAAVKEHVSDGPGGAGERALGRGGKAPSCVLGSWTRHCCWPRDKPHD